ncbi:MAG: pantoate--beta-alanine ligase [Hyphomicrobium sp.]
MRTVRRIRDLRRTVATWRGAGDVIALVPTMGALHDGHLELVKLARKKAARVVVSIFVNPTQFAANEDLSRYPRDEAGDLAKLTTAQADLVWAPGVEEMYGPDFASKIVPSGAALGLEGEIRPHHFGGVATVCAKLFNQVTPDCAVFGEKDYQQLCVIRQLVRDLDLDLKIIALPTVRESDGLARSSRNRYLSQAERAVAPALFAGISSVAVGARHLASARKFAGHPASALEALCREASAKLLASGFSKVDYIAVRDATTLAPMGILSPQSQMRVLAAAWLGTTRLIDNVPVA